jgi:hypothetical protein
MDNSVVTVTATNQNITIEPGGFKVYGNKQTQLSQNTFEKNKIALQPNPTNGTFYINTNAKEVVIYNLTGQLVQQFKGAFDSSYSYSIDGLNPGMYLVKVIDENNNQSSIKLIKK